MTTAEATVPDNGSQRRLHYLDLLRSVAVLGVLANHAILVFDAGSSLPGQVQTVVNLAFRTCTPLFFLMFGVMIEFAYVRRLEEGRGDTAATYRRLLARAGLCYLAYVAACLIPAITGRERWDAMLKATVLLGSTSLSDVLKFYAVMLLLAPGLLWLRLRWGPVALVGLCAISFVVHTAIDLVPWPAARSPAGWLTAFLVGRPVDTSYYSVLQGWWIIAAGMFLGQALSAARRNPETDHVLRRAALLTTFGLVILAANAAIMGAERFAGSFAGGSGMRTAHHPVYYASGIVAAIAIFVAARTIAGWIHLPERALILLTAPGRRSLLTFTVGNLVLTLVPRETWREFGWSWLLILLHLILMWALATWLDRALQNGRPQVAG